MSACLCPSPGVGDSFRAGHIAAQSLPKEHAGAVSPTDVLGNIRVESIIGEIFLPVIKELASRGIQYRGFLYGGLMISEEGHINVIEFNCRLGDPETQVLMMRLKSDLLEVCSAAVGDGLSNHTLEWTTDAAACVVLASGGYPLTVDDGKVISGLANDADSDVQVFHAGTRLGDEGEVITKGGRVLGVTALGKTVNAALENAYRRIDDISFEGMQYRKDIGGGVW